MSSDVPARSLPAPRSPSCTSSAASSPREHADVDRLADAARETGGGVAVDVVLHDVGGQRHQRPAVAGAFEDGRRRAGRPSPASGYPSAPGRSARPAPPAPPARRPRPLRTVRPRRSSRRRSGGGCRGRPRPAARGRAARRCARRAAGAAGAAAGAAVSHTAPSASRRPMSTSNTEPPGVLRTATSPPILAASWRTRYRPRPVPP